MSQPVVRPSRGASAGRTGKPFRVMVVDDSAIIRGMMSRWLEADPEITVVGVARDGKEAVEMVGALKPEVVLLDIEMPVMDGLTALPKIIRAYPKVRVIMSSTLTRRGAEISMKALSKGAADYVPKPESKKDIHASEAFREEVLSKVKGLAGATRGITAPTKTGFTADKSKSPAARLKAGGPIVLRAPSKTRPTLLAVGSSTGGPQALFTFFEGLGKDFKLPIVVTQHMPATFTAILADHISKVAGRPCSEGKDGERLANGHIYLAPGDFHMTIRRVGANQILKIDQSPPENFCRPAVDPLFSSVAKTVGSAALCVVFTGMGYDGLKGGQEIIDAGGTIIAQDEATSVVWGMPGAVATHGLCSAVLPLPKVAGAVKTLVSGGKL